MLLAERGARRCFIRLAHSMPAVDGARGTFGSHHGTLPTLVLQAVKRLVLSPEWMRPAWEASRAATAAASGATAAAAARPWLLAAAP